MNKIAIASDHGGYALKNDIIHFLAKNGYSYYDFGCYSRESVDYPDYAYKVGQSIVQKDFQLGILICSTGIGMSIAANKIKGIRASLCHDSYAAKMTREHNDSNVLTLGGLVIGPGLAQEIVHTWLTTDFSYDERHVRRLSKIKKCFECEN